MRIIDLSSDVCSSDLLPFQRHLVNRAPDHVGHPQPAIPPPRSFKEIEAGCDAFRLCPHGGCPLHAHPESGGAFSYSGKVLRPAIGADEGAFEARLDEKLVPAADALDHADAGAVNVIHLRFDGQDVVDMGRAPEAHFQVANDPYQRPVDFRQTVLVTRIDFPEILDPAAFKELQIAGVIDDAGEIRVSIVNPDLQPVGWSLSFRRPVATRYYPCLSSVVLEVDLKRASQTNLVGIARPCVNPDPIPAHA